MDILKLLMRGFLRDRLLEDFRYQLTLIARRARSRLAADAPLSPRCLILKFCRRQRFPARRRACPYELPINARQALFAPARPRGRLPPRRAFSDYLLARRPLMIAMVVADDFRWRFARRLRLIIVPCSICATRCAPRLAQKYCYLYGRLLADKVAAL